MSNWKSFSISYLGRRGAFLKGAIALFLLARFLPPTPVSAQQNTVNLPNLFNPTTTLRVTDAKAAAIVDLYLEAVGGKAVLDKITDRKTSYTNTLFQPTSEAKAEITLMMKGHYNLREEWKLEYEIQEGVPLAFVQIYNGDLEEAWVQVMGRVDKLDGKTLLVVVHGKYMDDFLCHWKDDGYVLKLVGEAEIDGGQGPEACDIVAISDFSARQTERFFFSRKSGLLLKKEWRDASRNPRKPIKREQYFSRYKKIPFMDDSGRALTFSMKQEIYGDGDLDTERSYTVVQFNSGLSDKLFDRPVGEPGPVVRSSGKAAGPGAVKPTPKKKVEGSAGKIVPKGTKGPAGLIPKGTKGPAGLVPKPIPEKN